MKIATWNVNSIKVRLPHVLDWLQQHDVDMLALQEIKTIDEKFPTAEFEKHNYHVLTSGQKTYNGVAVISKLPCTDVVVEFPNFVDPSRRVLATTMNGVRLINLYVPNGASLDSDKYQYKLKWLAALHDFLKQELATHENVVVVGDFNIAPSDQDVYDPLLWQGQVLVSEPERAAFFGLLELGLCDTFRLFPRTENQYSWWDYRQGAFRRNHGLRIDLILASTAYAKQCQSSEIDKAPRALVQPSDHAPVIANFISL